MDHLFSRSAYDAAAFPQLSRLVSAVLSVVVFAVIVASVAVTALQA